MSNPNALFLLADHIKLLLLEQKRAKTLGFGNLGDSHDGHVSRSLEQFREGLEALEKEHQRLQEAGDDSCGPLLSDNPSLSLLSLLTHHTAKPPR